MNAVAGAITSLDWAQDTAGRYPRLSQCLARESMGRRVCTLTTRPSYGEVRSFAISMRLVLCCVCQLRFPADGCVPASAVTFAAADVIKTWDRNGFVCLRDVDMLRLIEAVPVHYRPDGGAACVRRSIHHRRFRVVAHAEGAAGATSADVRRTHGRLRGQIRWQLDVHHSVHGLHLHLDGCQHHAGLSGL